MAFWKQAILSLAILAAAVVAWVYFVPGSRDTLAGWGIGTPAAPAPTGNRQAGGQQGSGAQLPVIASVVTQETINSRLSAIGTGRARETVAVNPYAAGQMTELLVTSGATVQAGDVIARLDSETQSIAVDRAKYALDDATAKQERIRTLRNSNAATAVQLNEAALAVDNARLALRDAALALTRRAITAPISGVVGILPVAAGNYVTSTTEIARIDDRSNILIDFWVPERYADLVKVGAALKASSVARPAEVYSGVVSALDNRIDAASRTLQVQARIENPDDTLRAGMSFQVTMEFPGDTFPAVDPLAVQWGASGAFVWLVRDGNAVRTDVRIIQRNTDTVLVDAPIAVGDVVVTEGVHAVRDGAPVTIARTNGAAAPSPATVQNTATGG
ncbi:MAG: efflux RND transporter periplasmic adaptor subunit [Mesorhizobium sp.]